MLLTRPTDATSATCVSLEGGFFHIATPNAVPAEVEAALKNWFRVRAKERFQKRVASWADYRG